MDESIVPYNLDSSVHIFSTPYVQVATLIVLDQAHESGVKRLGDTGKLRSWLNLAP